MLGAEHTQMRQDVAHAPAADGERLQRDRATAAHLAADGDEPRTAGGGGRRARLAQIADDDRHGRVERLDRFDVAAGEARIVGGLDDGARQDVEGRAARMQVEEGIGQGIEVVGDVGRDLLGDGAPWIAREGAVEVEPVDGRGAPARHHRMDVVRRHQDEPALHLARIELADQLADRDGAPRTRPHDCRPRGSPWAPRHWR
jgi:hypothetical protein